MAVCMYYSLHLCGVPAKTNGMHKMHSCDQVSLFYFIPIILLTGAECLEYILLIRELEYIAGQWNKHFRSFSVPVFLLVFPE